jgi:hypothetical protein
MKDDFPGLSLGQLLDIGEILFSSYQLLMIDQILFGDVEGGNIPVLPGSPSVPSIGEGNAFQRTLFLFNDSINSLKSFSTLIFELVVKLPEMLKEVKPLRRRHRPPVFEVGLLGLAKGTLVDGHGCAYFIKPRVNRQTR